MPAALYAQGAARLPLRLRAMARVGLRMMFHDKLKFAGTVSGVVFAVLLSVQQLSILFALLHRNTQFVDNCGADLWVLPPNTTLLQPGEQLHHSVLYQSRSTPGVLEAQPLVFTAGTLRKPTGGSEAVTLVGMEPTSTLAQPWNIVAGQQSALRQPDTMFFEDSQREKYGALNLGSIRELNGHRVRVGGLTWGLVPFGPAYAFADQDLVRSLVGIRSDRVSFVLIRATRGTDLSIVKARLAAKMPEAMVMTGTEFHDTIVKSLLEQQLGMSFGISTSFGLLIGLVIVSLSMFSSVLDNLREFGTLKAIGCTNFDLTILLLMQSATYAIVGSILGLGMVTRVVEKIRQALLVPIIPHELIYAVPFVMVGALPPRVDPRAPPHPEARAGDGVPMNGELAIDARGVIKDYGDGAARVPGAQGRRLPRSEGRVRDARGPVGLAARRRSSRSSAACSPRPRARSTSTASASPAAKRPRCRCSASGASASSSRAQPHRLALGRGERLARPRDARHGRGRRRSPKPRRSSAASASATS